MQTNSFIDFFLHAKVSPVINIIDPFEMLNFNEIMYYEVNHETMNSLWDMMR